MSLQFSDMRNIFIEPLRECSDLPIEMQACMNVSGPPRAILTVHGYTANLEFDYYLARDERSLMRSVQDLLVVGARQLQFQVHRYNDFQSAIHSMAEKATA